MKTLPLVLMLAACTPTAQGPAVPPPSPGLYLGGTVARTGLRDGLPPATVLHDGWMRVMADPPSIVIGNSRKGWPGPPPGARYLPVDLITPGFVDAHAHPVGLGRQASELDLTGVSTYKDALAAIDKAAATGEGWLLGRGWDQNDWPDAPAGGWPLATDLDTVSHGRPVALRRVDGHATWANSAAMSAAGISETTIDPPGGSLVREGSQPTGVLVDTAADLLTVPAPTQEQVEGWLRTAQDRMLVVGLVGVHDMGVDDTTLAAYRALDAQGALKVRVHAYLTPDSEAAKALLTDGPTRGEHLSIVGIKAYADGALGSRGAHLSAPYADAPETSGLVITDTAALTDLATRCLQARAQLAVHAIGDQAVHDTLDAFQAARDAVPDASDVMLRIEHAQVIQPDDVARFTALNVAASVQPTHATSDMPWAQERLGDERIAWAYTFRSMTDNNIALPLGSDFPVEGVDPALGLWAAMERTDAEGKPHGGWFPEQRMTQAQAINGFGAVPGFVVGATPPQGLDPAARVDLTLWKKLPGHPGYKAVATVMDGEIVWQADDLDAAPTPAASPE